MSLRKRTRLIMIRNSTSPYMRRDVNYSMPQPPLVLMSYSQTLRKAVSPFGVSIAGTIHNLQEAEPTCMSGELHRKFKLADEHGNWIHCVAHGRHAEDSSLENFLRIAIYFGIGRHSIGNTPQAIWIYKNAFMVSLKRHIGSPLCEQVEWQ